jgi:hypothetical protein
VWYRHNQRWLQASKEGTEASKSGSFKDEREWGKKCFEDLDQRRMGRPATSTWSTDFLLREGLRREEIGKWLRNKSIPWQRRRRLLQVVTGTCPCGQQLVVEMESLQLVSCLWSIGLIGLDIKLPKIQSYLNKTCALQCPSPVSSSTHLDAPGVPSVALVKYGYKEKAECT